MKIDSDMHWGAEAVDPHEASIPALKARYLLEALAPVPAAGRLCEVGCGDGKLLRTVSRARPDLALYGADIREPRAAADAYAFSKIEGGALPYASGYLDVVVLFDVLEHVPAPPALLREIARVLRPGGRLIAFVPIEGEPLSFYTLYRALLGARTYVETKDHIQAFTRRGLRTVVEEAFQVDDWRYAYHLFGHLMDASFFAAHKAKRIQKFWWSENAYYNAEPKEVTPLGRLLNAAMKAANGLAWLESTSLARVAAGSAGVLFTATRRA